MNYTRPLTPEEHKRGWYVLDCECYAHVFKASVLQEHPDLRGELCPKIGLYGVLLGKLRVENANPSRLG